MILESGSIPSSKQKGIVKRCTKCKVFIGRRRVEQKGISKRKERIVSGETILSWGKGTAGVCVMQMTSLVLIKKFQIVCLKVTFLGEVETASKSWFAVVEANDSILGLLFRFISFVFA